MSKFGISNYSSFYLTITKQQEDSCEDLRHGRTLILTNRISADSQFESQTQCAGKGTNNRHAVLPCELPDDTYYGVSTLFLWNTLYQ